MVHSLRKYLSNRGSALFMVLSTMTALMITCMAMYFAVVSSRSAQFAVFNQEQSYQSARSISDIILGGLQSGTLASGDNDLMDKMVKLNEGDTITTDGNGFASLNPDKTGDDDDYLGGYDVKITRLKDEMVDGDSNNTYDVCITTSVNGVKETIHTIIHIRPAQNAPQPSGKGQVFAATGYVDQDTYIDGGIFLTDMFIDTEYSVANAYPGMSNTFTGNLSTGGSLQLNSWIHTDETKPVVWFIRNTLLKPDTNNQSFKFAKGSKIIIGGDLNLGNEGGFNNVDFYVNGDFYLRNNNFNNCRIFVNGDIHVIGSRGLSVCPIYCNGKVINEGGSMSGNIKGTWSANNNLPSDAMSHHDAMSKLDDATKTTVYYKWEINDKYEYIRTKDANGKWVTSKTEKDPTYVRELDETHNTAVHKTIHWSQDYQNAIPTVTLTYSESEKGCIIDDTTLNTGNTAFNNCTLIIDTGDDPDNVYTIRVTANRDLDGDGVNETFCWAPANYSSSSFFKILVKGRGSVVIDVPEGVTYQDTDFFKTAHYNWWVLAGGTVDSSRGAGKEVYSKVEFYDTLSKFIHSNCGSGDKCVYTEEESTEECPLCHKKYMDKTCEWHERTYTYCPDCDAEPDCNNRVDTKAIDEYLKANPSVKARMEKDDNGNIIYPTTNIFLVSVEESADIRFSMKADGSNIIENSFFGFIYAPYMTFKGYGNNQGGGQIRFCGGATVSDFIFQDSMSLVTCWPEKMPTDLMSESSKQEMLTGSAKDWKISLGSY